MKQYFIAICIVLLAVSCSDDSGKGSLPAPPAPSSDATLTLMIPGFRSASDTRAGVSEAAINEIDVLLFRSVSGAEERVAAMLQVPAASMYDTSVSGEKRFSVNLPAGDYSRLALVVNAHSELTNAGITASPGSSYADLRNIQTTGRYGNLGFGPDKFIPMYGEYAPPSGFKIEAGVPKTFPGVIGIIRSMARVDFVNQETSADFVPSNVYFNNVANNGSVYVSPSAYGVAADAGSGGSNYLSPTLPASGLTAAAGSQSSPGSLSIDWTTPPPPSYTYYLYEQPTSGTPALNYKGITRPRMVLKATYKGRETWYPIDFTWDGVKGGGAATYTKGSPMPILRNHRYVFTIKEVKGPGYATWEEAFTAPEMFTNQTITIQTHVIDEAYTDIVFNSTGFLAVSRTAMTLRGKKTTTSTDNKVEVFTNVTGGFRVRSFNEDGTEVSAGGWLQSSQPIGPANAKTTVQAITDGIGKYKGYLEVHAGRLYTKVNVEQLFKLPLEYVAEYNLAGGSQYGSKPNNLSLTSAQTDLNLRWATSHSNEQSGYYNWYVCTGNLNATYNPGPIPKKLTDDSFFSEGHPGYGYHLPSRWEWTGVFSYIGKASYDSSTNQSVNEAIEFGGIKKTFASDYSSSGNGVCYALRFKQGTGNPTNDVLSSLSDFPLATDNSMLCAYRYTRMNTFGYDNNLTAHLKIDCVYLGSSFTGTVDDISDEAWWNNHSAETTTRIFPAAGYISSVPVSGSDLLGGRGGNGYYWSGTEGSASYAWGANFNSSNAGANNWLNESNGFPVRLFASE